MNSLVITPTYDERVNIERLFERIRSVSPDTHILVVDDNSPDGTGEYVKAEAARDDHIHLLSRAGKLGLGTAYCEGFGWALKRDYDAIIQMDADLSHDPADIPRMLAALEENDLVIGSRYLDGVNVVNWPLSRLVLSWSANKYAQWITMIPVSDLTGGFKCWRREVLENLDIRSLRSEGYSFQIETTFRAYLHKYRITEIPIVFFDRTEGTSKMHRGIIWEAVFMVPRLKWAQICAYLRKRWFQKEGRSPGDS